MWLMRRMESKGRASALVIGALVALLAIALPACATSSAQQAAPPQETPIQTSLKAGTTLDGSQAPAFSLRDQNGMTITLQQMRGRVVILTFLDATCTTECPITAQYLDWTTQFLGNGATQNVAWLAMSVNPSNTPQDANTFMKKNAVQVPLHVLMGGQAQLAPLWNAYHISVQHTESGDVEHTLGLYLIDAQGREREWVDGGYDPRQLSADIETLLRESR